MGLFDRFFKNQKQNMFVPDFSKEEYYNWLDFIENGGTSEEWKLLVIKNGWKFKENEYEQYQGKMKVVADKYFPQMHEIERDWSMLYKSKTYVGCKADQLKSKCEENISLYKEMAKIEREYGHEPPPNAPAFKRLAMLYEKQGEYDKSIAVCVDALKSGACGDGTPRRLERLIKKEKREPTPVEMHLINDNRIEIKEDDSIKTGRHNIPSGKIDELQKIEASEEYRQKIYKLYYFNYPEMPFISKDRELNTNWIEQASVFQNSIVKKSMMKRYADGLLPGHVYMLYWLGKYTNKRIPAYFEYKYGVCFEKEKQFLEENGFIENNKPTQKGKKAIEQHKDVIDNHSEKKRGWNRERKIELTTKSKNNIVENGYMYYKYIELSCDCPACKVLNGKVFPVSELEIGVNAPPMGEGCKCTISPYMDEKEFYDWLENTSNK